jgi:hypothetical protein
LEAVHEVVGRRLRGSGQQWVRIEAPDLKPLQGVHIEMPVAIEARTGTNGRVESVEVVRPAASNFAEAADYVAALERADRRRITAARPVKECYPPGNSSPRESGGPGASDGNSWITADAGMTE